MPVVTTAQTVLIQENVEAAMMGRGLFPGTDPYRQCHAGSYTVFWPLCGYCSRWHNSPGNGFIAGSGRRVLSIHQ